MTDRPKNREAEFLRARAAKLREIGASMPSSIQRQLAEVALELERRAIKFDNHTNGPGRNNVRRTA
jgi:hypothetical protein